MDKARSADLSDSDLKAAAARGLLLLPKRVRSGVRLVGRTLYFNPDLDPRKRSRLVWKALMKRAAG